MKKILLIGFLFGFTINAFSQASGNVDLGSQLTNGVTTGGCTSSCSPTYCSPTGTGNSTQTVTLTITGIPAANSAEITITSVLCGSTSGLDSGDDIFIDGVQVFDGGGNAAVNITECVAGGADIVIDFIVNRRDEIINVTWASGITDPGPDCFLVAAPVELISFLAEVDIKNEVTLDWATSSELNNDFFDIEYSVDGTNFRAIGEVIGNGTTQLKQEYSYTHTAPVMGLNYYRLKQVDFDGAFEYSDIRVVEIKRSGKIVINPSAAYSEITVELAETIGENNVIGIYDMMGRMVMMSNFDGTLNVKTIDISNLHKGYYVVRVQAGGEVFTERFMKMVD